MHHLNPISCAVPLAGDHKRAEIQSVQTAEDLWKAIGRDSWIVVPIDSTARPGGQGGSHGWSCRASGAAWAPACIALRYRRGNQQRLSREDMSPYACAKHTSLLRLLGKAGSGRAWAGTIVVQGGWD